jgi:hypothetical protein
MIRIGKGVIGTLALIIVTVGLLITSGCAGIDQSSQPLNQSYHKGYPLRGCDGRPAWWCENGPLGGY